MKTYNSKEVNQGYARVEIFHDLSYHTETTEIDYFPPFFETDSSNAANDAAALFLFTVCCAAFASLRIPMASFAHSPNAGSLIMLDDLSVLPKEEETSFAFLEVCLLSLGLLWFSPNKGFGEGSESSFGRVARSI